MSGLGNGLVNLFKSWGRGIGNAADKLGLGLSVDARKAIRDEVISQFEPLIKSARIAENRRATNIKDLGDKLTESKANWKQARDDWNTNYNSARDSKKKEMDDALADWTNKGNDISSNLAQAQKAREDYINNYMSDLNYDNTVFIDTSGNSFRIDPFNNFKSVPVDQKWLKNHKSYDTKFIGNDGKLVNLFDDNSVDSFTKGLSNPNSQVLNYITSMKNSVRNAKEYKQLDDAVQKLEADSSKYNANSAPEQFDEKIFKNDYQKTNGKLPTEYSFNGQTYSKEKDLDQAYQAALAKEQKLKDIHNERVKSYLTKQKAKIAQRIQDAKDIKKAKLALGGALGAGALYAGAKAMYGGDDTPDNTDNTNNIDNTDNTYTGEPDHKFNVEKEGQAILKDRQQKNRQQIDTDFDPDKAEAILAAAAYDKGVEDSNSIESSDDNFINDDELYGLLKAMKDPYKADAVANYIYSKHGNESDVQNLGWRGWLNKYYGDSLRSRMHLDPSGYKGMHISGGL